jgi:hypothetical protein
MTYMPHAAARRNTPDVQPDLPLFDYRPRTPAVTLTPGAREIQKRTRWSASLCNAVAAAWSFGSAKV